ncbi:YidB family protein [Roseomonas elaeocarpi]|uniref:YidB family protein n=1 Tax=Roseomonas elaeocarpi TaxID=907779 RepID=A0ABV6JXU5_9PROT
MSEFLSRLGGASIGNDPHNPIQTIAQELLSGGEGAAGVRALGDRLSGSGLDPQLMSWIGSGENQPADPQAVEQAVGPDRIEALAGRTGLSRDVVLQIVVALLPLIIDHFSPKGRLPQNDEELPQGGLGGVLGGILGRLNNGNGAGAGGLGSILGNVLGKALRN